MKKILLISIIMGIVSFNCKETKKEYRWGTAVSGLRIRVKPTVVKSKIVGLIPYGEKIILLEEVGEDVKIAKKIGKWTKVNWKSITGYTFGGFLSTKPPKKLPPRPKYTNIRTITGLVQGDIACYIDFKDTKDKSTNDMADFSFCETPAKWIGKKVTVKYTKTNVQSSECMGDPECTKSQKVNLITKIIVVK